MWSAGPGNLLHRFFNLELEVRLVARLRCAADNTTRDTTLHALSAEVGFVSDFLVEIDVGNLDRDLDWRAKHLESLWRRRLHYFLWWRRRRRRLLRLWRLLLHLDELDFLLLRLVVGDSGSCRRDDCGC